MPLTRARQRKKAVILPKLNAREAAVVEGIEVYGVSNLRETFEFLAQQRELEAVREDFVFTANGAEDLDFSEVKGHTSLNAPLKSRLLAIMRCC